MADTAALQAAIDEHAGARAIDLCRLRVTEAPDDAQAHRHLAVLLAAAGDFVAAQRSARRACELAPEDPRCWSDLGRVYAREGLWSDASLCFSEAIRVDTTHADAWHNLGIARKNLRELNGAFVALKRVLVLDPGRAETYLTLGGVLIETGQLEDALECFERATRLDPTLARARTQLGFRLSQGGQVDRAQALFRQSVGLDPDHVQGWYGLANTLEDLGEAENALACYRQVLARRPDHGQALGQSLALLRDDDASMVEHASRVVEDVRTPDEGRAVVAYGLLKYHDRRKDFAAAARAGLAANAARRRTGGAFDRARLSRRVDSIIATYTKDFFRSRSRHGLGTDQPVFIVGLPRSGTTLTEQIVASHPLLHGAGELTDLSRIAGRCVSEGEEHWRAAMNVDAATSREYADAYLGALRAGARQGRLRISDKSPLNFFNLGLAAVLFPNARVIHCKRNARDNALSIWMENFNADQLYATDFDDLAFYTEQYRRLMQHWSEHLPLKILDFQYEDTVADLEFRARKLIDFLGAPWDDSCLAFHESKRSVQTPSRWQVRQPIYNRSVERWRNYQPFLPDLDSAFVGF